MVYVTSPHTRINIIVKIFFKYELVVLLHDSMKYKINSRIKKEAKMYQNSVSYTNPVKKVRKVNRNISKVWTKFFQCVSDLNPAQHPSPSFLSLL